MADFLAFCIILFALFLFVKFLRFLFTPRPVYRVDRVTVVRRVR